MKLPDEIDCVLFDAKAIADRVGELGRFIDIAYAGKGLVAIGVLKGAFIFTADLVRKINVPVEIDFVELASYMVDTKRSGEIVLEQDVEIKIKGRDILIIEDIVDTGLTTRFLIDHINIQEPASVEVCTLLYKPARQRVDVPLSYVGFEIDDVFAVGYGLDYGGKYRNLPDIVSLTSAS
ncbi:MAG: hypoxanthine phosphoribosyltransferase [Candidatus Coatesbacteria bacterium]|nr:MAG: hypoxanthine phosphoribosyltransferase [Candidatus Coatesbacteria bacterium]